MVWRIAAMVRGGSAVERLPGLFTWNINTELGHEVMALNMISRKKILNKKKLF